MGCSLLPQAEHSIIQLNLRRLLKQQAWLQRGLKEMDLMCRLRKFLLLFRDVLSFQDGAMRCLKIQELLEPTQQLLLKSLMGLRKGTGLEGINIKQSSNNTSPTS